MSYKDYYQLLEVPRTAPQDEIQKAFKKLARKYHPDVNKEKGAEDRFKEISEGYDVLKDPEKRKLYDKYGSAWKAISEGRQPPPGTENVRFDFRDFDFGGQGFGGQQTIDPNDLSSIFEQFFAGQAAGGVGGMPGMGGVRGRRRARGPTRGDDRETVLELGVSEAMAGGSRDLGLHDPETGQVQRLTVKIPGGVRSGQRIRLAGKGGSGAAGGPPGDLFLEVKVVDDPRFRLEGDDVYTPLAITPWEAALGTTAALQTLDGEVRLKVPPGTSSGRNIRLREKGYPRKDGGRGDLYAAVQVMVPESLTEREKELFEQLAKESPFKAR